MREELAIINRNLPAENTFEGGWNDDRIRQVHELALLGLTEEQMMRVMNVGGGSFRAWKKEKEGFLDALKDGGMIADAKVAASFYKRATGYDVDEDHVSIYKGVAVITTVKKHIPPDPWSCSKWLSVRQRALWSETQRVEVTNTNINISKIDYTGMSDDEVMLIKKLGFNAMIENAKHSQ